MASVCFDGAKGGDNEFESEGLGIVADEEQEDGHP